MYKRILVALDATRPGDWRGILPEAVAQARAFGATLHLLTVVPEFRSALVAEFFPRDFEENAIGRARDELQSLADSFVPPDVACECRVAHGRVVESILEAGEAVRADLLVMGISPRDHDQWVPTSPMLRLGQGFRGSVLCVRLPELDGPDD